MSYYRPCPVCGANCDPGEICDCTEKAASGAGTSVSGKGNISVDIISPNFDFVKEQILMGDRIDILLVRNERQTVGVIAPFAKAKVGDLVQYDDGCIGKVVDSLEWQERGGQLQGFVAKILDIFEVETVFNLGYAREENTNGN